MPKCILCGDQLLYCIPPGCVPDNTLKGEQTVDKIEYDPELLDSDAELTLQRDEVVQLVIDGLRRQGKIPETSSLFTVGIGIEPDDLVNINFVPPRILPCEAPDCELTAKWEGYSRTRPTGESFEPFIAQKTVTCTTHRHLLQGGGS